MAHKTGLEDYYITKIIKNSLWLYHGFLCGSSGKGAAEIPSWRKK